MTIQKTRWTPDTCSCVIEFTWDDSVPEASRVHSLNNYINKCVFHTGLATDAVRFSTVTTENQKKNIADSLMLQHGPSAIYDTQVDGNRTLKNGITLSWSWSGTAPNRVLTISYTGITLTTNQRNIVQAALDTRFGSGKVLLA